MFKPQSLPPISEKDAIRFWSKVSKSANKEECWDWRAAIGRGGYGKFHVSVNKKEKSLVASRVAYFLYYQINPGERLVLHRCDRAVCTNPAHLFLGSHKENMKDKVQKNRCNAVQGSKNKRAKLSESIIPEIISERLSGKSHHDIAKKYGVAQSTIWKIFAGEKWKHIVPEKIKAELNIDSTKGELNKNSKLNASIVRIIRDPLNKIVNNLEWAKKYGVNASVISRVKNKKTWMHVL